MDIRRITPEYAVAAQISPSDMADLAAAGFATVINNRPDTENPPDLRSDAMRAAADAAGLVYVDNPVVNGGLTMDMIKAHGAAIASAGGPVFAWCRTGTRSSIIWALSQAGKMPSGDIVALLKQAGYDIPGLAAQIDAVACSG